MTIPDIPAEFHVYSTTNGLQLCGDSREVLRFLPSESIDLIVTSPPFALQRKKSYGNKEQHEYVEWLCEFGDAARRVLKETGSFVIDLGGSYEKGKPVRSLYNFRILIAFCDRLGYRFAEDFYWFNPAKLPSPIEWVNIRKMRAKDSVNTVWWFSKGDWPKADVTRVLTPYSDRKKKSDSSVFPRRGRHQDSSLRDTDQSTNSGRRYRPGRRTSLRLLRLDLPV